MVKFYLSVDQDTQLIRFESRLSNPLTYWKFSENDLNARKKWALFTKYKNQMFDHTSSDNITLGGRECQFKEASQINQYVILGAFFWSTKV